MQLTNLDDKMIGRILQEYKIHNCELLFKEDSTVEDLIDVIEVGVGGCANGGVVIQQHSPLSFVALLLKPDM